jgi:hypothetical protein
VARVPHIPVNLTGAWPVRAWNVKQAVLCTRPPSPISRSWSRTPPTCSSPAPRSSRPSPTRVPSRATPPSLSLELTHVVCVVCVSCVFHVSCRYRHHARGPRWCPHPHQQVWRGPRLVHQRRGGPVYVRFSASAAHSTTRHGTRCSAINGAHTGCASSWTSCRSPTNTRFPCATLRTPGTVRVRLCAVVCACSQTIAVCGGL